MRHVLPLAACAAAALAPAANAGLPSPCTLLSNAQVAKAFGTKVQTRMSERSGPGRSCTWEGVPEGSFTSAHATLHVDIARVTRAQFLEGANRAKGAVRIHGIGELAYTEYMAGAFLSAWQHGVWIGLDLTGTPSPQASAEALARAALARLP